MSKPIKMMTFANRSQYVPDKSEPTDWLKVMLIALGVFILVVACAQATGCGNRVFLDTQYNFNYAYIQLQDGTTVQGKLPKVNGWCDYEDGDQLQVKIDGVVYLVHSSNCTLIYDPELE